MSVRIHASFVALSANLAESIERVANNAGESVEGLTDLRSCALHIIAMANDIRQLEEGYGKWGEVLQRTIKRKRDTPEAPAADHDDDDKKS